MRNAEEYNSAGACGNSFPFIDDAADPFAASEIAELSSEDLQLIDNFAALRRDERKTVLKNVGYMLGAELRKGIK